MTKIQTGAWRDDGKGSMQVISGPVGRERVRFQAPPAAKLDGEMNDFLNWFNKDASSDPVLKAGAAHLWFVTLHPFDDGNGRIARAIMDMSLARSEDSPQRFYSMSTQIRQGRKSVLRDPRNDAEGNTRHHSLDGVVSRLSRPRHRRRSHNAFGPSGESAFWGRDRRDRSQRTPTHDPEPFARRL
jgi:hypothetical protein